MKFVCVLKSGGDFVPEDVKRLGICVKKYAKKCNFTVLSDMPECEQYVDTYIPLTDNLPGWWSIIEVFKLNGPLIFTGLDTVLIGSIYRLIEAVRKMDNNQMMMLKPFNPGNTGWASGIMAWKGDFQWLYSKFEPKPAIARHKMEQKYTSFMLRLNRVPVISAQSKFDGIYSYKRHCAKQMPKDARFVIFHGLPRPVQVSGLDWVQKAWEEK